MKKYSFALLFSLSIFLTAPHAFASTTINTCGDFENINSGLSGDYILGADLSCASAGNAMMIGSHATPFSGTLDGQGHKITVNISTSSDYVGLFSELNNAIISSFWVSGSITGGTSTGAIAGRARSGANISMVKSDATVSGGNRVGGLVGFFANQDSTSLLDSYFTGTVNGGSRVGGLVGYQFGGTISDSYSLGAVTGTTQIGGIDGYDETGAVHYTFSIGALTGSSIVGAIIGQDVAISISANFWDATSTGISECVGSGSFNGVNCMAQPNSYFKNSSSSSVFFDWDFASAWAVRAGDYPGLQIFGETDSTPDTTAPSVSITAPASGSTVGGTSVTLSASSSDDVAVAGVQFYIGGVAIGSEDTVAPYSVSWDSTTASSGPHTIYAIARDTSNNYRTSIYVIFNTDNVAPDITGIGASATRQGASIVWTTDKNTSSQIVYSSDTSYSSSTSATDTSPRVSSHMVTLSGLRGCTTYNFKVVSTDAHSNTATSSAQSFKTGCGHYIVRFSSDIATSTPDIVADDNFVRENKATTLPILNLLSVKAFQFSQSLKLGSNSEDVRLLQAFLNKHGFLVAKSGPGSLGNETTFFQARTKVALIKFQEAHAKEILVPLSLKKGTGDFFAYTMKEVNAEMK